MYMYVMGKIYKGLYILSFIFPKWNNWIANEETEEMHKSTA